MYISKKHKIIKTVRENLFATGYKTIPADVSKWFKIFNREIFENRLSDWVLVSIKKHRNQKGGCIYEFEEETDSYLVSLELEENFETFNDFLFTLAHECVHNYEWSYQNVVPCHGKNFWKWKNKLKKFEIILTKQF